MRESQLDLITSAMTMRRSMRDLVLRVARSEVSPRILEQMREMVRADIAWQDQERLRDKGLSSG